MAEIRFDNGTVVELPQEITGRLWKELFPDAEQLKVDCFRALKVTPGIRIAIMRCTNDVWNGEYSMPNVRASYYFSTYEIKEIIAGLTRMLDE